MLKTQGIENELFGPCEFVTRRSGEAPHSYENLRRILREVNSSQNSARVISFR